MHRFFVTIFSLSLISTQSLAYSPYSTDALDELEKDFVTQINQSPQVIRDPLATHYLNTIGLRLAKTNRENGHPDFFLVKTKEINAFAGPGGHIGVNTGLILATVHESELAAVMAHELAHVRLHHLYDLVQNQSQMRIPMLASLLAAMALSVVNPALGSGAIAASLTGFSEQALSFSRKKEREADRIGIDMLQRAGYDTRAMITFFKTMLQHSRYYYTADIPAMLRSHPLDEERIAEAEARSQNHLVVADSVDYAYFKEWIIVETHPDPKSLLNRGQMSVYARALVLIKINQFEKARSYLNPLALQQPDNIFVAVALSEAECGANACDSGINRLAALYAKHADHPGVLFHYANRLDQVDRLDAEIPILLQGFRRFPNQLIFCEKLAKSYAKHHQTAYAYFTKGQCAKRQQQLHDALRYLRTAKQMAKKDAYLTARIDAMISEIKNI